MQQRKTVGEKSFEALLDNTKYDPVDIGLALTDDIMEQLIICANRHKEIMGEEEYFVCLYVASDPLLATVRRHKYCALPFLPKPRPHQAVFLYNKVTDKWKRLWSLPNAWGMACLSQAPFVSKQWRQTKGWCEAFFRGNFWEHIRKEHGISHLAEEEFLALHSDKIVDHLDQKGLPSLADSFDFSKVQIEHIADTATACTE